MVRSPFGVVAAAHRRTFPRTKVALAAVLVAGAGAAGALAASHPKGLQQGASLGSPAGAPSPSGASAPAPMVTTTAPVGGGGDPWSGVLFSKPDPFAPGAVPPPPAPGTRMGPGGRAAAMAPAAPVPPLAPGEQPEGERVQALYRQAMMHWAAGKSEVACGELGALETRVVRDSDARTAKKLLKAEEAVIDQVAAADLEVLLPIARMHFEVYQAYLRQPPMGHALVENHSRTMVRDLALLYRKQSGSEGATLVASHVLTVLGDLLRRGAQHESAAELYTQAAELDPRNPAPALNLGLIYEKFEQYQSAANWLRKVVALDPTNQEARLRLAINLGRLGKTAEETRLLEVLTAEHGDSWVLPLAFEELARLHETRAPAASEKVLRQGLERYPRSVRMRVQLAAALDHQGKVKEGRQVIDEIATLNLSAPESSEGARFRYNTSGADTVAASRTFFEENVASRMRVLEQALGEPVRPPDEAAAGRPAEVQQP